MNNHLTVLRRLLSSAVEWEQLDHLPPIKWLKVPDEFDFLDFEEAGRLVAGADEAWRPMILTGLKAGLRLGELIALRWEDIDLVAGRLMVRRAVAVVRPAGEPGPLSGGTHAGTAGCHTSGSSLGADAAVSESGSGSGTVEPAERLELELELELLTRQLGQQGCFEGSSPPAGASGRMSR